MVVVSAAVDGIKVNTEAVCSGTLGSASGLLRVCLGSDLSLINFFANRILRIATVARYKADKLFVPDNASTSGQSIVCQSVQI